MSTGLLTRAYRQFRNAVPNPPVGRTATRPGQGVPPLQDQASQMAQMGAVSTLFGVVDRIASTVAAVDWHLYREFEPGTPVEDRTEVVAHPALEIWNRPNPHYTQRSFVEAIQQHYELTGEQWAIVAGAANRPLELWPVRPDRMAPIPDPTRFISGYKYCLGRMELPLEVSDVLYTHRPNPLDPYRGISPVGTLARDLASETAAAEWNAAFFRNSARPDGIIEVPDGMTDSEFEMFEKHWDESHRGALNAHRVAVLERGTYKPAGYTQKDMDFVSLRDYSSRQILEAYAMPKFMLGQLEGVNRATAWAAMYTFTVLTVIPRLDVLREMLNSQFLPLFGGSGRGVMFDYGDPTPPDPDEDRADLKARVDNAMVFIDHGFDVASSLDTFGLPPVVYTGAAAKPAPAAGANVRSLAEIGFDPVGAAEAYGITGVPYDPSKAAPTGGPASTDNERPVSSPPPGEDDGQDTEQGDDRP